MPGCATRVNSHACAAVMPTDIRCTDNEPPQVKPSRVNWFMTSNVANCEHVAASVTESFDCLHWTQNLSLLLETISTPFVIEILKDYILGKMLKIEWIVLKRIKFQIIVIIIPLRKVVHRKDHVHRWSWWWSRKHSAYHEPPNFRAAPIWSTCASQRTEPTG